MRRSLLALLPLLLSSCRDATLEPPGIFSAGYSLNSYDGQALPTLKACGGYTVLSGGLQLDNHRHAVRTLTLRDETTKAVLHTSDSGTYRVDGADVLFTFSQPEGSWQVHGSTAGDASITLIYPAPCDGNVVETYEQLLNID